MERRRLWVIALYITVVLAVVGIVVFIGALVAQYFSVPADINGISPFVLLALGGLCLAAAMFLLWFTLVGVLLARQTREQGSGYGDAYRLIEAFKFRDAIPLLERSIREGKETSEVLMLLTSAYAYTGQLAKAQATADRAVQLYPDEPAAYITLANGYRLQASYDAAARTLIEAARLDPDQPVIWANSASASASPGRMTKPQIVRASGAARHARALRRARLLPSGERLSGGGRDARSRARHRQDDECPRRLGDLEKRAEAARRHGVWAGAS
ncbi:MAG: tetratricopeptide repeat protein [Anaerolineae bacterium]